MKSDQMRAQPALAQPPESAREVRGGEQAPVRGERIGAEDEQEVAAVDVRDRDDQDAAEHRAAPRVTASQTTPLEGLANMPLQPTSAGRSAQRER